MRFRLSYTMKFLWVNVLKSFVSFILTGLGNAALDFILYFIFNSVFQFAYVFSQLISYTLATLNRYFVFKYIKYGGESTGKILFTEAARFTVVSIIVLIISAFLLPILHVYLNINLLYAKLIVTITTMSLNAFCYNYVVFINKKNV